MIATGVLLPLCLATAGAVTGAGGVARDQLAAREGALTRRGQAIDAVAHWHGIYRTVREVYVEGPSGMVAQSQCWLEKSAGWVRRAHAVVDLVRASRGRLQDPAIRSHCLEEVRGLHDDLAALRELSVAARARGEAAEEKLSDLGELAGTTVPAYADTIQFLVARRDELRRSVQALSTMAASTEQTRWERSLMPLARGIAAAVRAESLLAPELSAELAATAEALSAAAATYPHQLAVRCALDELQVHILARRYFRAREGAVALTASRNQHVAAIEALGVDPALRQEAIADVDRLHASGSAAWRALQNAAPAWLIVAQHLDAQGRVLAAQCRDADSRAGRNCGLLRQFVGMPAARLEQMGEDELLLIERSLERVAAGPLS